MDKLTLTTEQAAALEAIETAACRDLVAAASDDLRARLELTFTDADTHALVTCKKLRSSFVNRLLELGLRRLPTEPQAAAALEALQKASANLSYLVHTLPPAQPPGIPAWLETRGLALSAVWDRIACQKTLEPVDVPRAKGQRVEIVAEGTLATWAGFVRSMFGGEPADDLLRPLVGRPGWYHALLRRQGTAAGSRSMFITPDHKAWLGLEMPVPGTPSGAVEDDQRLIRTLLNIAAEQQVTTVIADIPVTHPQQRTAAYEQFAELGFQLCYARRNYMAGRPF